MDRKGSRAELKAISLHKQPISILNQQINLNSSNENSIIVKDDNIKKGSNSSVESINGGSYEASDYNF